MTLRAALLFTFCVLSMAGCKSVPKDLSIFKSPTDRSLAAEPLSLTPIVRRDNLGTNECTDVEIGEICELTWRQSVDFCKDRGMHLPTAREYAQILKSQGTQTLETGAVTSGTPPGFYLVDCQNEDGSVDSFFMNHIGYRRLQNLVGNHRLWTASSPPRHTQYAHVYYDEWGGGGGNSADHLKTKRNAFQCVRGS